MIHLLFGKDDYRRRHALHQIRTRIPDADDMLESNTVVLDGRNLTPAELLAHATAVPFLAPARLVIVEGLIAALAQLKGRRRKNPSPDDPLEPWRQVVMQLSGGGLPDTTTLVLVEGDILEATRGREKRPPPVAFTMFADIAQVQEFDEIGKHDLPSWISARSKDLGVSLSARAVAALSRTLGPDLWAVERELEKLSAYADGAEVTEEMVDETVSAARDTKVFDMTDAIVAGNTRKALASMRDRLDAGDAAPMLSFMVTRAYRQLIVVKDMRSRRLPQQEVARAAGLPPFRIDPVGSLAARYSWDALRAAYARLVEVDLSVKRGECDDETALQLLVHELSALAPAQGAATSRRR